jgi:hypothetical protein
MSIVKIKGVACVKVEETKGWHMQRLGSQGSVPGFYIKLAGSIKRTQKFPKH